MLTKNFKAHLIGYLLLPALLLLITIQPGYAQTPEPTLQAPATAVPLEQSLPGTAEVTFAQLNQANFELRPPIAQRSFDFDIPYRWDIAGGQNYVEINYSLQHNVINTGRLSDLELINPTLELYFNNILISSVSLVEGLNQSLRIPITPEAASAAPDNNHQLRFVYFSGECDYDQNQLPLVIYEQSFIHFDYELLPLDLNLADFPRPLVQDMFTPEPLVIILPDQYSDTDLAVAASVAATLGQRAFGQVTLDIVTASQATPERLANVSAIIIGQPTDNAFLFDLYQRNRLPTTLTDDNSRIAADPASEPIATDEGVLQEIVSDFNGDRVYLIVTGNSEIALTRAAQTLSVLAPRYGFDGNLVIVADFQEILAEAAQSADTFALADFGFNDTTFVGLDTHTTFVNFSIPSNWEFTDPPTLNLSYIHSSVLQPGASGLTIKLNDKPVGSVPIDQSVLGERQAVIELPPADFKLGSKNRLSFEAIIKIELPNCSLPELELAWLRINETSQLHLPHLEVEEKEIFPSLKDPFSTFASRQDLSDIWFSLPELPTPEELNGLIGAAFWLGNYSGGPGFNPHVSQGPVDDTSQLDSYHVIAFGRPTRNPVIAAINEQLPQPFVPGKDNLRQQVGNVIYRLPNNFNIGLLQALPAPWNSKKAVLVATGTSVETEALAINTLIDEESYYELWDGNIAFIRTGRIELFDSTNFIRGLLPAGIEAMAETGEAVELEIVPPTPTPAAVASTQLTAPESEPVPDAAKIPQQYQPQKSSPPTAVTQLIFGLIGTGLLVAAVGGGFSWRKNKNQ